MYRKREKKKKKWKRKKSRNKYCLHPLQNLPTNTREIVPFTGKVNSLDCPFYMGSNLIYIASLFSL